MANFTWAVFAAIGVILSACYMLWLYQRVFYGETSETKCATHMPDLNLREWAAMVPLIVMMVWMGVYSQTFLPPVSKTNARACWTRPRSTCRSACRSVRRVRAARPLEVPMPAKFLPRVRRPHPLPAGDHPHRRWARSLMVLDPLLAGGASKRLRASVDRWRCWRRSAARDRTPYTDPGPAFGGMLMVDGFATFFRVLVIGGRHPDRPAPRTGSLTRQDAETGEYHALLLFSIAGQCVMVDGQRADHDLHRPGDLLHRELRAGRLSARRQAHQRSRAEVFPAGLVRHGVSSCTAWR